MHFINRCVKGDNINTDVNKEFINNWREKDIKSQEDTESNDMTHWI